LKIVFSLPVHENADVVIDQIRNFQFFAPDSLILLHVSNEFCGWGKYSIKDFEKMDNVIVNPARMSTSYGTGVIVKLHVSNFEEAQKHCKFDFFNLHSSNDMFIKHGLESYLKTSESGFFPLKVPYGTRWVHGKEAFRDKTLRKIMKQQKIQAVLGSQIEGTFYSTNLFEKIAGVLKENMDKIFSPNTSADCKKSLTKYHNSTLKKVNSKLLYYLFKNSLLEENRCYAKEEVYFPTIAAKYAQTVVPPYTYINWPTNLAISKEDIDDIRQNSREFFSRPGISASENHKYREIFSVKRIARVYDDPLREYIRSLTKK
jgi:hypothetical protein